MPPLAHRLGMQKIKWELEDTSLKYLDPEGYNEIMRYLNAHQAEADAFMKAIQSKITTRLSAVGIHGSIYGRIKHVYSIYRKMKAQDKIDRRALRYVCVPRHRRFHPGLL